MKEQNNKIVEHWTRPGEGETFADLTKNNKDEVVDTDFEIKNITENSKEELDDSD